MTAIVLAAGMSTRMGALKQLLPLKGRTLIELAVEPLIGLVDRVCVVLGHRHEEVARALGDLPVECVLNPRYRDGMLTSVQAGLYAAAEAAGYLLCLGDQPGLPPEAIAAVLAAAGRTGRGIVVPTCGGRRGHPVYLARRYRQEVLGLSAGQALRAVTRGHPADTLELEVGYPEVVEDVDTPEDYAAQACRRDWTERG
ncbi:MAG: nucleotidyltransferase family protein [Candidatus Latescibacterota bacterium]